jgi:hypothetical protein
MRKIVYAKICGLYLVLVVTVHPVQAQLNLALQQSNYVLSIGWHSIHTMQSTGLKAELPIRTIRRDRAKVDVGTKRVLFLGFDHAYNGSIDNWDALYLTSSKPGFSPRFVQDIAKLGADYLYFGIKRYFVGNYTSRFFNLYLTADLGIMQYRVRYQLADYDNLRANYDDVPANENLYNLILGLGLGTEYHFRSLHFFASTRLILPSGYDNTYRNQVSTPITLVCSIGVRASFRDIFGL